MGRPKGSKSARVCWTDDEVNYLIAIHKEKHKSEIVAEMSAMFNRKFTISGISCKMKILGLEGKGKKIMNGRMPWNKGLKGVNLANSTSFKKGRIPPNKLKNGTETTRADGYVWIKHNDEWILKQRYIYEKHYGKIKEGYKVVLLDSDKNNLDISNLALANTKEIFIMNRDGLIRKNTEITRAGLNIARIEAKIGEIEKGK